MYFVNFHRELFTSQSWCLRRAIQLEVAASSVAHLVIPFCAMQRPIPQNISIKHFSPSPSRSKFITPENWKTINTKQYAGKSGMNINSWLCMAEVNGFIAPIYIFFVSLPCETKEARRRRESFCGYYFVIEPFFPSL